MHPPQKLTEQLRRVAEQAKATAASVYLPTPWESASRALLLQVGAAPPLTELASQEAAEAFSAEVAETGHWNGLPATGDGIVVSRDDHGLLIPVPLLTSLWAGAGPPGAASPRRRQSDGRGLGSTAGWVGLRFPPSAAADEDRAHQATVQLAHSLASTVVSLYGLLTDPLTGLPGRNELHGALRLDLHRARRRRLPCALVLVNPIGLDWVNAQHGRRAGDAVVREIVQSLQSLLRRSDVLMRYGGAIFALPLGNVGIDAALLVAERVRGHLAGRAFLNDVVRLRCAVGVVACEAGQADALEPLDLLRRANEALAAAREQGGDAVVAWHDAATSAEAPATDRLFGIFTGRTDKDYRNMGLLWDVLQVLSAARGTTELAQHVVDRLRTLLRPDRVGLFVTDDAGPRLLVGQRVREGAVVPLQAADVTETERALMDRAVASSAVQQGPLSLGEAPTPTLVGIAVPLVTGGRVLGTLSLAGAPETLDLDKSDLPVLTGVAAQLAVALDREHLADLHRVQAEHERRRLQAEVQDLRSALQQSQFVFQSPVMHELLGRARRVAATDTTVLITGESGTGKERLAQTVHQLSARRARPFVIVDCGAIPATLIDSELFGHERGAFTGAQQRSLGRLAQADGGTVFLDEIGELPLDVQSRLLRFVQEKTISMVGGTRARSVDVRIIAATNRRLEDEVRAGRFREDLFYRLNVVRLHIPPLRERPEDVRLLAEHFARTFAAEQRKPMAGFSRAAEARVVDYAWPGNVRELQNVILQAVVLSDGDELDAAALALPEAVSSPGGAVTPPAAPPTPAAPPEPPPTAAAWDALRDALAGQVEAAATAAPRAVVPIGRWLAADLVLAAHDAAGGARGRAAARLGLPPTTFARQLSQAQADRAITPRPPSWPRVLEALAAILAEPPEPGDRLVDRVDRLLQEVVVAAVPRPLGYVAALLDLSLPTLKRRLAAGAAGRG
ncbi:MAG: sigma 54-interacting transcriptional regulator [Vicinamibacterales bacterium]